MGVPQEDRHLLFDWSNRMVGADDPEYSEDPDAGRATAAAAELYVYASALGEARREDPRDDVVTKLINAEIDGRPADAGGVRAVHACCSPSRATRPPATPRRTACSPSSTNPEQLAKLRAIPTLHRRRGRGDPALVDPGAALPPHGHAGHRAARQADQGGRQGRDVAHLGEPGRGGLRGPVPVRHRAQPERPHRVRWRRRPLLPRAPTWRAWSCGCIFERDRARARRTCSSPARSSGCGRTSSVASSTSRSPSRRASVGTRPKPRQTEPGRWRRDLGRGVM